MEPLNHELHRYILFINDLFLQESSVIDTYEKWISPVNGLPTVYEEYMTKFISGKEHKRMKHKKFIKVKLLLSSFTRFFTVWFLDCLSDVQKG